MDFIEMWAWVRAAIHLHPSARSCTKIRCPKANDGMRSINRSIAVAAPRKASFLRAFGTPQSVNGEVLLRSCQNSDGHRGSSFRCSSLFGVLRRSTIDIIRRSTFDIRCSTVDVRHHSAFDVRRSTFNVRRSTFQGLTS